VSAPTIGDLASHLDDYLRVQSVPDYAPALNGLQLSHRGPVHRIAAAVDVSLRTIDGAIAERANVLLVHHGMFWAGLERMSGPYYERVRRLITGDIAVYAAHLPLDVHDTHGNSRLLAAELALQPSVGFAQHEGVHCGVSGESDVDTTALRDRFRAFSRKHGGDVRTTHFEPGRRTRRWAICTGSGANMETLREATAIGVDTLLVGEGPHWTAVDAQERGLVIMYGGHYATETLGVCSLAAYVESQFGVPWTFVPAPTGL
jgi:dinuclear metal center YbgI/SA1388 family protein